MSNGEVILQDNILKPTMQIATFLQKPTTKTILWTMSFSTRSPVLSAHGCVACGQPLAAEAGLRILQSGGNAADAAVAVAACMNVTQPCSTGVGGDCFCLFYDAANKKVHGINGRCVVNSV